jgi:hypothetical protein
MKKRRIAVALVGALVCVGAAGCSNSKIDTTKVRAAFASVQGDAKAQLDTALAAIDQSNYVAAVAPLQKASYELKMDKAQREILTDTLKKVRANAARQK